MEDINSGIRKRGRKGAAITPDMRQRIIELYPTMKNTAVADELGIHKATVERAAKKMGLKKDPSYLRLMRTHKAKQARAIQVEIQKEHPRENWKTRFPKGHNAMKELTEEEKKEYRKKISNGRNKTIRKERIRIDFGLPQQTRLKLTKQPRKKLILKYYLRRKGYDIDEENGIAYYNECTTRAFISEKKGNPWFAFKKRNDNLTTKEND